MAPYRASLMPYPGRRGPAGAVDALITSFGQTANVRDDNWPTKVEDDGSSSYAVETPYVVIEGVKRFIAKTMSKC